MFTSRIDLVLMNENKSTIAIRDIIKSYEHICLNTSPNSPQHITKPYLTSLGISFWQQGINTPQPWGSSSDCIWYLIDRTQGFPSDSVVKNVPVMQEHRRCGFDPWVGKILWRRAWKPTPVFLPGESHEQKSLEGYSPWGHKELDRTEVTEQACTHFWEGGSL